MPPLRPFPMGLRRKCPSQRPNERAFSGELSERSERPERWRGRRVRCNAMLGTRVPDESDSLDDGAAASTLHLARETRSTDTRDSNVQDGALAAEQWETYDQLTGSVVNRTIQAEDLPVPRFYRPC